MTTLADRTIDVLRQTHDELAALVPALTDEQLTGPSGASQWTVAQVLSHLGSGAEISLAGYRGALDGTPAQDSNFNQTVWDRWNAMSPQEQAAGFLAEDATVVALLESTTGEQREGTEMTFGFLPAPIPLASTMGMRLNETVHHSWDVRVALDPAATLDPAAADVLVEHFAGAVSASCSGSSARPTGCASRSSSRSATRMWRSRSPTAYAFSRR